MSVEIASLEKVREAVAALHQQSKRATAEAVIAEIGGGSKQTVLRHLKSIRSTVEPEAETVPQAVIDAARPILAQIFAMGIKAEALRGKDVNDRLHRHMADLETQVEELAASGLALETQIGRLKAELAARSEELLSANERAAKRDGEIDRLQRDLSERSKSEAAAVAELFAGLEGRVFALAEKLTPATASKDEDASKK